MSLTGMGEVMVELRRPRHFTLLFIFIFISILSAQGNVLAQDNAIIIECRLSKDFLSPADPTDAFNAAKTWTEVMDEEFTERWKPVKTNVEMISTLEELAEEIKAGKVDSAYISTPEYCTLRKLVYVRPVMINASRGGLKTQKACLVVKADSAASSIRDLKGKTFAYFNKNSVTGYLFPQWLLLKAGQPDIPEFFKTTIQVSREKSALYAVIFGEADAASVSRQLLDTLKELNPAMAKRVKVIAVSEPMPEAVGVVRKGLDEELLKRTLAFFTRKGEPENKKLKQVFTILGISRFAEVEESDLDYVESLVDIIRANEKKHLDPICGKRLAAGEAKSKVESKAGTVYFCCEECRKVYEEHCERARPGSSNPMIVYGIEATVGSYSGKDTQDVMAMVRMQSEHMENAINIDVGFEVLSGESILRERFRNKTISMCGISARTYVEMLEEGNIKPLVRAVSSSEKYRLVLISLKKKGYEKLEDLKGISLISWSGEMESLFLRNLVQGMGSNKPMDFFACILNCPSEQAALRAVLFGQADAACVKNTTLTVLKELNPVAYKNLKILATSEKVISGLISYRSDLPPDVVTRVREFFLGMDKKPRLKELLTYFKTKSFVPTKDSDFDGVRKMLKKLKPR